MLDWLKKVFGGSEFRRAKLPTRRSAETQSASRSQRLRAVPGALVASDKASGKVIYNMLTPHMQQFMGRCIGAIKRVGIAAKGTGQFSIMVGEEQVELCLDDFYQPTDDPALVERVVAEARRIANVA